jgi:CBS domain-containing protein
METPMPQRAIRTVVANQKILTAPAGTSVTEAARLMKQSRVGAIMVVEMRRLVGIFTERDALLRVLAEDLDPHTTTLRDVMTADPQTIEPDRPFAHALHMMFEGGFRHVPVVERGKPLGMVSARDALALEAEEFEAALQRREHIREIL